MNVETGEPVLIGLLGNSPLYAQFHGIATDENPLLSVGIPGVQH
jgi:hypothetical protein